MAVKSFFTNIKTNISQMRLNKSIKKLKKQDRFSKGFCVEPYKQNKSRKIVLLDEPISDIDSFNEIIDILSGFISNEYFKQNTNTLVRAFNKEKSGIIGYSTIEDGAITNYRVTLNFFKELLEFVVYLSLNNLSLEDVEQDEVVWIDSPSKTKYQLLYPHHLKFFDSNDNNDDYMVNVKWFLKYIALELNLTNYLAGDKNKFEKKFFLSSNLLKIYIDVFFNNRKIKLDYLQEVIDEEEYNKSSYLSRIVYNPNKFHFIPDMSTVYFSTFEYNDFINSRNIIYEEENFFIKCYKRKTYLIFKEFNDETLKILKTISSILQELKSVEYSKYCLDSLVYNTIHDHPIGILLNIDSDILKNKNYYPLGSFIETTNGKNIITIVKNIVEYMEPLYKAGYSFDNQLDINNILYVDENKIIIKDMLKVNKSNCDKITNLEEFVHSNISEMIMNIFCKLVNNYHIENGKIFYRSSDNIIFSFSPKVIINFESFVINGEYEIEEFYNGIIQTIKNYTKQKGKREYYSKYLVSPVDLPIKILNEEDIKEHNQNIVITNRPKVLNEIVLLYGLKEHIKDLNISLVGLPSRVYYSEKSNKFYAFEKTSNYDKSDFCKLSEIDSIKNTKSNKDIVKIIINLLNLRKSNFYVNFERLIYINENNDLCLLVDYLLSLNKIKLYNRNVKFWRQKLDYLIINLLHFIDFPYNNELFYDEDNIVEQIDSLIYALKDFYDGLNKKCKKHNFWFNDKGCCKICNPNDVFVDLNILKNPIEENQLYNDYTYKYFGKDIILKIFKNEQLEKTDFVKNLFDGILYNKSKYHKKVLNIENMDCIGYGYLYQKDVECFEINEIVDNKKILECILSFIDFIKNLHLNSLMLNANVLEKAVCFSNGNNLILKDLFCIEKYDEQKELSNNILNFVACYLHKSKSFDDISVEQIISKLKHNDYEGAKKMIKDVIKSFNSFCKIHLYHFSDKVNPFCPECFDRNTATYPLKDVENCEVFSDSGKEAIIYDIGKALLAKVYRKNENGSFIKEIDIIQKQEKASKLLKMPNLNNTLELGHNFEIVNIEGIILDEDSKFCGIVMKKKVNTKSVKVLTDRAHIKKLNISRNDILQILISIGKAIEFCHQNNMYIGDISYNNILFNPVSKEVYIIDLDSINFGTKNTTVFTEQFVDPLSITKKGYSKPSDKADWYAFATLAFYMLTMLHPFNGIYLDSDDKPMSLVKRKVNKISVLDNHNIKIPPIALSWEWMSNSLKSAFLDIFEKEQRYNITNHLVEELNQLQNYSEDLVKKIDKDTISSKINIKDSISDLNSILVKEDRDYILLSKYVKYPWNDGNMSIAELENFKKKFYICDNKIVFSLAHLDDIRCYFSNTLEYDSFVSVNVSDIIDDESANISQVNAGFAIPYTNVFLCLVCADNKHYLVKCEYNNSENSIDTDIIGEYDYLPNISLSINTKNGNNNIDDLINQYKNILIFISENYNNTYKVFVYFDAITNKWLVLPYRGEITTPYIRQVNGEYKKEAIDFPYDYLENNSAHYGNMIFFNDAIYYPADQKICSINLNTYNYIEFLGENISEDSTIEIIKKGFRIYNIHHVYDLIKEDAINNGSD